MKLKEAECAITLTGVPHKTATNGSYFVVRALLQMLVSVVDMWSMSGALTGSGDSLTHSSSCLGVMPVSDPPPALP